MKPADGKKLVILGLSIRETNDEILGYMRAMKAEREECSHNPIVCLIDGFNNDPRELFDIPEVRAFCRRLMTIGFASYLDYSTTLVPGHRAKQAWGAFEVWLCAEGRMKAKSMDFPKSILDEFWSALMQCNESSEKTVGAPGFDPTP
jgi:hypothetical protein